MERVSDTNNNKMDVARCNRMIGEVYCEMSDFDKALKHQKKHLSKYCYFYLIYITFMYLFLFNVCEKEAYFWLIQ